MASYSGVPIRLGGVPLGALCVIEHTPREWTRDEVKHLEQLGACASDVIESKAANRLSEELREEYADFAFALSEELFVSTDLAHEMVSTIRASAPEGSVSTDLIDGVDQACAAIRSTIRGVQDYGHALNVDEEPSVIDLTEVVSGVAQELGGSSGAAVDVSCLPKVWGYRPQLESLFRHVLDNALRYTRPGVAPHVTISSETSIDDGCHRITVVDNGRGLDVEEYGDLFRLFVGAGRDRGCGLGLAICRRITYRHGGEIALESDGESSTTVTITLPCHGVT